MIRYMAKRYGVEVTNVCRICSARGATQMHHIISQDRCRKIGRPELITNPGNIVELCIPCHDHTTASLVRRIGRANPDRPNWLRGNRTIPDDDHSLPGTCRALKRNKDRCTRDVMEDGLCWMHHKAIRRGLPPHKSEH